MPTTTNADARTPHPADPGRTPATGAARQRPTRRAPGIQRSKVVDRLLNRPLRDLGAVGAVVVLGSTAAFGGLEPAEQPTAATVDAGQPVAAAPYEVTIDKVLWVGDLPGVYLSTEGNRWIAVMGTVLNTHSESLYGGGPGNELAYAVSLRDVEGLVREPDAVTGAVVSDARLSLADGSSLSPVQPGLTYQAVFLFEQDGAVPPPTDVTVALHGHTWRAGSLDRSFKWWEPRLVAESEFPVREAQDQTT